MGLPAEGENGLKGAGNLEGSNIAYVPLWQLEQHPLYLSLRPLTVVAIFLQIHLAISKQKSGRHRVFFSFDRQASFRRFEWGENAKVRLRLDFRKGNEIVRGEIIGGRHG